MSIPVEPELIPLSERTPTHALIRIQSGYECPAAQKSADVEALYAKRDENNAAVLRAGKTLKDECWAVRPL